jgi:ligand-binding sensor domain-containing protein
MRTEFGVARFDGYTFESFDYDPNNPQTPYQKIHVNEGLFLDKRGNIWLNYDGVGLSFYDYSQGRFHHFKPDEARSNYIGNRDIYCFYSLSNHEILVGTDRGLYKYNYHTSAFTKYEFDIDLPVRCLFLDNVGNLWIGTGLLNNYQNGLGVFLYQTGSGELHKIGDGHERINSIYQDSKGKIWLATNQGIGRVQEYSPGITDISQTYYDIKKYFLNDGLDVHRNNFTGIAELNDQVWLWGNLGIARILSNEGKSFTFKMYMHTGGYDNHNTISFHKMIRDSSGSLWAITENNNYGLTRYDRISDKFESDLEKGQGLQWNEGRLLSGFIGRNNILWLGTERYGLLKIDLEQKRFRTLKIYVEGDQSSVSNNVFSITPGQENTLWLGTANGVARYHTSTEKFDFYNQSNTDINGNVIFCSFVDSRGYLWLGHNPDQVSRVNTSTWENLPFKYVIDDDTTGFYAWAISTIKEDHEGDVWVASHRGGIYECIQGERNFRNFKYGRDGQDLR